MSSTLLFGSVVVALVQVCASFYAPQMPFSYQRYMDENRSAFLRPGAPLPVASFLPNVILVNEPAALINEEPAPPLPTPLPLQMRGGSVPRRALRQFADDTSKFKRMRPCFYSPIQCLMKRSAGNAEQDQQPEAEQAKASESN